MTEFEYIKMQRDMHRSISGIKKEEFCRQKVTHVIDETFSKYESCFKKENDKRNNVRKNLIEDVDFLLSNFEAPVTYKILSDYINYDFISERENIQNEIGTPLSDLENDCIAKACYLVKQGYYNQAIINLFRLINNNNFELNYNLVNSIKDVIKSYSLKSGIDLDKIELDYNFMEKEFNKQHLDEEKEEPEK